MDTELKIITAPTVLPVSIAEAKRHLGVSEDAFDLEIESLIKAACNQLMRRSGIALTSARYQYSLENWPVCTKLQIPYPPLTTLVSVEYKDENGTHQTIDSADYVVVQNDGVEAWITPAYEQSWPTTGRLGEIDSIRITYDAGTDDLDLIPPEAKLFIRQWVASKFDSPDGTLDAGVQLWQDDSQRGINSLVRSLSTGVYIAISPY